MGNGILVFLRGSGSLDKDWLPAFTGSKEEIVSKPISVEIGSSASSSTLIMSVLWTI